METADLIRTEELVFNQFEASHDTLLATLSLLCKDKAALRENTPNREAVIECFVRAYSAYLAMAKIGKQIYKMLDVNALSDIELFKHFAARSRQVADMDAKNLEFLQDFMTDQKETPSACAQED